MSMVTAIFTFVIFLLSYLFRLKKTKVVSQAPRYIVPAVMNIMLSKSNLEIKMINFIKIVSSTNNQIICLNCGLRNLPE